MKKALLLSTIFILSNFITAEENTVLQNSSIVFDFVMQPEESNDAWQQITHHTQTLIARIKNMKENSEAEIVDVVHETLQLTNTICDLAKNSNSHGSIVCNMYITDENINIEDHTKFPANHLIVRFNITRTNDQNPEHWEQVLNIAKTFAEQMNSANDYDLTMITNNINSLLELVKENNRTSLVEGIHISLNSECGVNPESN